MEKQRVRKHFLMHVGCLETCLQTFSVKSVIQKGDKSMHSSAPFELREDWHSRLCKLLLVSAVSDDSGNGLPAIPV